MERRASGEYVFSEAEAGAVRAALFVALHHHDDTVGHCDGCYQTVSGCERSEVRQVMDELNGGNARLATWLREELEKWALRPDDALGGSLLRDLLRSARERGVPIPARFRDRA